MTGGTATRTVFDRGRLTSAAPWVMVALLACSNALLLRQNLRLRAGLKESPRALRAGDTVSAFRARTVKGDAFGVQYPGAGSSRVLLYFSPSCVYSSEQFAYWSQLIESADRNRFQIIGAVSDEDAGLPDIESYLRALGAGAAAERLQVVKVGGAVRRDYKLFATPTTLVIANDGRVERVWQGTWESRDLADASHIFGINFDTTYQARREAHAGIAGR